MPALVYAQPAWKDQLQRVHGPRRRIVIRHHDNVAFLPAPVAGYRIRHDAVGSVIEIKPRHAPAVEVCRCRSPRDARFALAAISSDHARPFLGEIWERAA